MNRIIIILSIVFGAYSTVESQTHKLLTRKPLDGVVRYVEEFEPYRYKDDNVDDLSRFRSIDVGEFKDVETAEGRQRHHDNQEVDETNDVVEEEKEVEEVVKKTLLEHFTSKDSIKSLISNILIWALYVLTEAFYETIGF